MRRLIAITEESYSFREHERIVRMLRSNSFNYVHIRKPNMNERDMREYLSRFPKDIRHLLCLNDHQELAKEYGIGGIHINSRFSFLTEETKGLRISKSCHSIEEAIESQDKYDYCFLSPIFDSISKKGYKSAFDHSEIRNLFKKNVLHDNVFALSGVTTENIPYLEDMGFNGVAMLGAAWQLPRMMFITHQNERYSYIQSVKKSLSVGIKFLQLRMKDATDDEVMQVAEQINPLCEQNNAILTIDDRIELLETGLFDGVHVGKNDMPLDEAKQITGKKFLLGATCNTIEDVENAIKKGADYIGMGPYRFTTTKKNLAPILGLDGYKSVISKLKPQIPIYAIGGIEKTDIKLLREVGVYGVAVSSMLLRE